MTYSLIRVPTPVQRRAKGHINVIDPEAEELRRRKLRRWSIRRIIILAVLAMVLGAVGLHDAGFALLIGGATTGETTQGAMAHLNCTYFTGTEKVINHIMRPAGDAGRATRCPLVTKLAKAGPMDDMMREDLGSGTAVTIQEGPEPALAPTTPATAPVPAPPNPNQN